MKKVIFLDCDGVLNNMNTTEIVEAAGFIGVDDRNLKFLIVLAEATQAEIVLSSTWQHDKIMLAYLKEKLAEHDLALTDITNESGIHRGEAIRRYVREHDIERFVVLDDFDFDDFQVPGFMKHVVLTNYETGMTAKDVQKAIAILG